MIIDDLDLVRAPLIPAEADPPSFVDTDAVLTLSVTLQSLGAVAGWRGQVLQNPGPVKIQQLPPRRPLKRLESCRRQVVKEVFGFFVIERLDHNYNLLLIASHVKSDIDEVMSLPA
jgi:hypothetical protein